MDIVKKAANGAKDIMLKSSIEEFLIFKVKEKDQGIQTRYENENLWMAQKALPELFDIDRTVITKHLKNIFKDNEHNKNAICTKFAHTTNIIQNFII